MKHLHFVGYFYEHKGDGGSFVNSTKMDLQAESIEDFIKKSRQILDKDKEGKKRKECHVSDIVEHHDH